MLRRYKQYLITLIYFASPHFERWGKKAYASLLEPSLNSPLDLPAHGNEEMKCTLNSQNTCWKTSIVAQMKTNILAPVSYQKAMKIICHLKVQAFTRGEMSFLMWYLFTEAILTEGQIQKTRKSKKKNDEFHFHNHILLACQKVF